MEQMIIVLAFIAPFILAGIVQLVGQRRGWSGRRIIRIGVVIMWLWYSAASALGAKIGYSGAAVLVAVLALPFYGAYRFVSWAFRDVVDHYEQHLEKKRKKIGPE